MSRLDSIIAELKKSLEDTPVNAPQIAPTSQGESAAASRALKDFLANAAINEIAPKVEAGSELDPKEIAARRKALSDFLKAPLQNDGTTPYTPGVSFEKNGHSNKDTHSSHGSHEKSTSAQTSSHAHTEKPATPFTPPPELQVLPPAPCPDCVERKKKEKAEVAKQAEAAKQSELAALKDKPRQNVIPDSGLHQMQFSMSAARAPIAENANPAAAGMTPPAPTPAIERTPNPPVNTEAPPAKKSAVSALLSVFSAKPAKGKEKEKVEQIFPEPASGPSPVATKATAEIAITSNNTNAVAWYRHINIVESALRMSDVMFADSLLNVLTESSTALNVEPKLRARILSLEAKLLTERKLYPDAEALLKETLNSMDETIAKSIAAAYCWHALTQCYTRQGKAAEAKEAHAKAVSIAESALGDKDPETMLMREPPM